MDKDFKWLDALKPYYGGGIVPYFKNEDGSVDAVQTIDNFARLHGLSKAAKNGEYTDT